MRLAVPIPVIDSSAQKAIVYEPMLDWLTWHNRSTLQAHILRALMLQNWARVSYSLELMLSYFVEFVCASNLFQFRLRYWAFTATLT